MKQREVGLILIGVGTSIVANGVPGGPQIMAWPPPLDYVRILIGLVIVFIGWRML